MTKQIWEVWKDGFNPKEPWLVQMPKGRVGFATKKAATAFAEGNKLAGQVQRPYTIRRYHDLPQWWIINAPGNHVCFRSFPTPEAAQEWLTGNGYAPAEHIAE